APEEHRALVEWNATTTGYPRDKNIPQIFKAVAEEMPGTPAVRLGGRVCSFRDLDRGADRVARKLVAHGIARGDQVGVYLERCLELPAALLGILKAGASFVPLDPSYPRERLAHILSDSGAKAIVTTAGQAPGLSALSAGAITIDEALAAADPVDPLGI